MSNFRTIDRETGFLLPPSVDEWLPEKHLARFGRLAHGARHHQQTSRRHRGLGVVALIEAAAGHRHDARLLVGQVDLVVGARPLDRRFGRLAAGLFPARLRLRLPRREPGFVLRLLARMAFLGPRLDLRPPVA